MKRPIYVVKQHGTAWRVTVGDAIVHEFSPHVLLYNTNPCVITRDARAAALDYCDSANATTPIEGMR